MDDSYRSNGLQSTNGAQGHNFAPHSHMTSQRFHGAPSNMHTLPPLNSNASQFAQSYPQSAPQTPLTPHTPQSGSGYGHHGPASAIPSINSHPPLRPLQPSPSNVLQGGSFSSAHPSALSSTASHPNLHSIAPAPQQDLRPIQQGGLGLSNASSQYGQSQMFGQPPVLPNQESEPVHVVGQQGRRGVLPTVPGRPPPNAGKTPSNPTKNNEGKFECPHCNKTYLHLKHLKRHLLRRT